MDETSTDLWDKRGKIWQPKDSILPMVIQKSRDRGKSIYNHWWNQLANERDVFLTGRNNKQSKC